MFVLAHEAGHPMFHHLSRIHTPRPGRSEIYGYRGGKPMHWEPTLYNIAGDHVINIALKDCGFDLWKDCYCDEQYRGMTTEQVYDKLEQKQKDEGKQLQPDKITGLDIMAPAAGFSEDEVREIVSKAAAIARSQGKLPASLENLIKEATEPQYPVWMLLERFIDSNIRDEDQSFHLPNRRYLPYGIVQPSPFCEKISDVTVVYDTSGSVPDEDLQRFHKITGDILRKLQPQLVRLIQCDAAVHKVDEFKNLSTWATSIKLTGRGGTSFIPPFEELSKKRITPSCLVYLTDMEGSFPDFAPPYPVLWVSTSKGVKAPFGMTIEL
jgi:predicted metal-dependent peptidase